jgi:putative protease
MLIEAPLRKSIEVEPLIAAGADLFYAGVLSKEKINNRHNTILHQFPDFNDFGLAVKKTHYFGKRVFLTLNGTLISVQDCIEQVEKAVECGVDGFIITNLVMIDIIRKLDPTSTIYLSVLVSAFNSQSIKFYLKEGVKGLCLPRNLSLENIEQILSHLPKLEVAAFVSGNCSNTQSVCRLHGMATKEPIYMNEGGFGEFVCEGWCDNYCSLIDSELKSYLNRRKWCPLCQLSQLEKAGVTNLKIEGRSLDTLDKIAKVKHIKSALNAMKHLSSDEYVVYCKMLYRQRYGEECKQNNCYYHD